MRDRSETLLNPVETRIAEMVIAREESRRTHLVVALSGAHAYGFPSPDSDLDLKAIHIAPTESLLGFADAYVAADRLETIEGVEIDYTSNEIGPVLRGVLSGNGNYAERILGAPILHAAPELEGLIPLAKASLSKRIYRHYKGFAESQLRALDKASAATAKSVLYVLRTTLTGAHALDHGEIVPDLATLKDHYGFSHAAELIERKKAGERTPLDASVLERWRSELERAFQTLDESLRRSVLPDAPTNADALEAWLIELRSKRLVSARATGST
ncbi:MAG: nucleotidyltransferase domain-containing protein [Myxococcota bacterium]